MAKQARERLGLTAEQADCARIIAELTAVAGGISPTYAEICAEMGIGRSQVHWLVTQLEERGWLVRGPARSRSIRLLAVPEMPPEVEVELTDAGRAFLANAAVA